MIQHKVPTISQRKKKFAVSSNRGNDLPTRELRPCTAHRRILWHGRSIHFICRACLRSGVGLLTVHVPIHNHDLLQTTVPEAIVQTDIHDHYFAEPVDTDRYQAIAIGPGLGQEEDTALAMMEQIQGCPVPLVLDADAINIFGTHRNWLSRMPKRCILTPHLKELERLIGKCMDTYERLTKTKELAAYLQSYIIIKGSWSTVVTPEGNCYFNPTGNPGMATAAAVMC